MIKLEAIIRPDKLDAVKKVLEEKGFCSLTVEDVQGRGAQGGIKLEWRVGQYNVEFMPKVKLVIICKERQCNKIIDLICESAGTGEVGDGKIIVSEVKDIVKIRTRERGEAAI